MLLLLCLNHKCLDDCRVPWLPTGPVVAFCLPSFAFSPPPHTYLSSWLSYFMTLMKNLDYIKQCQCLNAFLFIKSVAFCPTNIFNWFLSAYLLPCSWRYKERNSGSGRYCSGEQVWRRPGARCTEDTDGVCQCNKIHATTFRCMEAAGDSPEIVLMKFGGVI